MSPDPFDSPRPSCNASANAPRYPGGKLATVAAQLIDEGLRMEDYPGIVFRDGPTGRRAALATGPDLWEVITAIHSTKNAEPGLSVTELVDLVSENTGLPARLVHISVSYWAAWPTEIDERITANERAEATQLGNWKRTQRFLTQ